MPLTYLELQGHGRRQWDSVYLGWVLGDWHRADRRQRETTLQAAKAWPLNLKTKRTEMSEDNETDARVPPSSLHA